MPDLLVRKVPQPALNTLKRRAAEHRRSLQQELLSILIDAAAPKPERSPAQVATAIQERLARSGRAFADSAPLIRADRER